MLNEIIAIYAITDDLLKAIGHHTVTKHPEFYNPQLRLIT
jgi:hypothetical protein